MSGALIPHVYVSCCSTLGQKRWGGMVGGLLQKSAKGSSTPVGGYGADTELSKEQFQELLTSIDAGLRGLPATAQVRAPL